LFEGNDPDKDSYEPIWEYNFDIGYFSTIDPIIHNDKVIFSGLDEKKNDFSANSTLEAFSKDNGELIWKWDETVKNSYDQFNYLAQNYVYNHVLYISTGVDYAIDLNEGKTRHYLNESGIGGQHFNGVDNMIFASSPSQDDTKVIMKCTDINSFSWSDLQSFNNNDSIKHYMRYVINDKQNDDIIIMPLLVGRRDFSIGVMKFIKYDLGKNTILSEDTLNLDYSRNRFIDFPPEQNEDNVYLSLNGMVACIDKETFEVLWQKNLNGNSSRSGIMYADDKLFVNTEFVLYALDAKTGGIMWQIESRAGSRMQAHKGVVYYRSGSVLRGVDMTTGEILLEIEAPSRASDNGAYFQPVLTIDHDNDRIYTASYTHAYCYPTLR
jgi:outer membrane protein assembly factor BamB